MNWKNVFIFNFKRVLAALDHNYRAWIGLCDLKKSFHLILENENGRAKSTDRDKLTANKLTAKQRFHYSGFVTDFVAVISSQSEGLGKMALGIVKIYLGSPFSANRCCPRSVCSRSVGSRSVCCGQLSWTRKRLHLRTVTVCHCLKTSNPCYFAGFQHS